MYTFYFNTQPIKLEHFEIELNDCHVNNLPLLVNSIWNSLQSMFIIKADTQKKSFLLMVIKEMPIETFLKLYIASFGCVFTVFYCSIWIMRFCYLIDHFAKIQNVQQKGENEILFTIRIYELHLHKYLKTRISLYIIMPYKTFISYKNSRQKYSIAKLQIK